MTDFLKIADLDEASVAKIKDLEQALGSHIMAYQPGLNLADLEDAQVKELKTLEKELDVILVAYDEQTGD